MGKKKFINKKNSATYQLLARDTSDPNYAQGPNGERVFIRVDNNNQFSIHGGGGFSDDDDHVSDHDPGFSSSSKDPDSIFADADDEEEDDDDDGESRTIQIRPSPPPPPPPPTVRKASSSTLPDNVRKEILELGFPDDGYNYLAHLREIKNTGGGGSAYYENSKAKVEVLPLDVKAYDASRVRVPGVVTSGSNEESSVYGIAASTIAVRVQKAVDPEVSALLDDSDMSRFGSDVEDLEDDFVVEANVHEEGEEEEEEEEDVIVDKKINLVQVMKQEHIVSDDFGHGEGVVVSEKPRVRRLLDEQFDMLTLQEYGTESDSDYDGSVAAEDVPFADKLNVALKDREIDDFDIDERYKAPADFLRGNDESKDGQLVDSAAHVIRRCAEYGEMYADESQNNEEVIIFEESSDESEVWDCETIVTTYSNLDNHPGTIVAPMKARKKRLPETIAAVSSAGPTGNHVISLRGKEKIPVDFLPGRKAVVDKVSKVPGSRTDLQKGRPQEESKEEKKERKAAVKEERREARKAKKELKEIYRGETQRAQKVVAISGPSSIHLM